METTSAWYQRIEKETEKAILFVFVVRYDKKLQEEKYWVPAKLANVVGEHEVEIQTWFIAELNDGMRSIARYSDIEGREEKLNQYLNKMN